MHLKLTSVGLCDSPDLKDLNKPQEPSIPWHTWSLSCGSSPVCGRTASWLQSVVPPPKSNKMMSDSDGVKVHDRLVMGSAYYFLGCLPSLRFLWQPLTAVITWAARQPQHIMEICLFTVIHKLLIEKHGNAHHNMRFFSLISEVLV